MKKFVCMTVAVVLLAGYGPMLMAADGSWTGWLADANCAKNYEKSANAGHAGCAKGCVKKGAKWAIALKDASYVLDIDPAVAESNVGREVTIKGSLSGDTIKVSSVN